MIVEVIGVTSINEIAMEREIHREHKGKRRKNVHGFSPAINYKPSDMRKIVAMDMDEKEIDIRNFDFSENL